MPIPPTNAQRSDTQPDAALLHLVQKRSGNACAAGTDRVADGNSSALDVDLIPVPIQLPPHSQTLGSERFVKFDPIHIFEPGTQSESNSLRIAGAGPIPMMRGSTPALAVPRR